MSEGKFCLEFQKKGRVLPLKHSRVFQFKISGLVCGESVNFFGMPAVGEVARLLRAVRECC